MRSICAISMSGVCGLVSLAAAQSSSMMRLPPGRPTDAGRVTGQTPSPAGSLPFVVIPPKENVRPMTRAIERMSLIAVPSLLPRKFKTEDLITIIVRQQKKYKADAKLETEKKWDISGKLSEWFRFYRGNRLGSDNLSNGEPGFKFAFENEFETDAENERKDKYITRIQATVIDVKPNGNLVLEAKQTEQHDEELIEITLTGVCRTEDVTPDNTILSTQVAELVLVEKHQGAMRDATRRGWVPRILDWARPF